MAASSAAWDTCTKRAESLLLRQPDDLMRVVALNAEASGCLLKQTMSKRGKIGAGAFASIFEYVSKLPDPTASSRGNW
jgi:hypothetical protein